MAGQVVSVSDQLVEVRAHRAKGKNSCASIRSRSEGALVRAKMPDLAETRARIAELDARVLQEEAAMSRAREQLTITETRKSTGLRPSLTRAARGAPTRRCVACALFPKSELALEVPVKPPSPCSKR